MAFPMPPAPRLNAEFYWECPTCRRAFARPESAAQCHRPAKEPPTVAAPLVRWSELAMWEGHPLTLTSWRPISGQKAFWVPQALNQNLP